MCWGFDNKLGWSCAKLRPASLLSLLFWVNLNLCKSESEVLKIVVGSNCKSGEQLSKDDGQDHVLSQADALTKKTNKCLFVFVPRQKDKEMSRCKIESLDKKFSLSMRRERDKNISPFLFVNQIFFVSLSTLEGYILFSC